MDRIVVFGLGFMGREVATLAAQRGMKVTGVDISEGVVDEFEADTELSGDADERLHVPLMRKQHSSTPTLSLSQFQPP